MSRASVRRISASGHPAGLSGSYLALDAKTFAITVQSSMMPITMEELPDPELFQDYPLYVTRAKEDGQTRYRLRLGAFDSLADAEAPMPALRLTFPAAWANELSQDERVTSSAVKYWRGNAVLTRAPADRNRDRVPSNVTQVKPAGAKPVAAEETVRPVLTPRQLERPSSNLPQVVDHAEHVVEFEEPPVRESLIAKGLQRYNSREKQAKNRELQQQLDNGVQSDTGLEAGDDICSFALNLGWSQQPLTRESLPELVIFDKHYLYAVRTSHDGQVWYGLRLGFFPTRQRAEQLTYLLSKHFESALVIPVRSEEFLASAELAVPSSKAHAPIADGMDVDLSSAGTAGKLQTSQVALLRARPGVAQPFAGDESETKSKRGSDRQSSVSRIGALARRPLVLLTCLLVMLAGAALYQILYYT